MLLAYTLTLWLAPPPANICSISPSSPAWTLIPGLGPVSVSVFDVPDQLLGCQQVQVLGLLSPAFVPWRSLASAGVERVEIGWALFLLLMEGVTALASRGHNIKTWWNFTKIKVLSPSPNHMPGRARPSVASDNDNDGRHLVSMSGSMSMWISNWCGRRRGMGCGGVLFYDHGQGDCLTWLNVP